VLVMVDFPSDPLVTNAIPTTFWPFDCVRKAIVSGQLPRLLELDLGMEVMVEAIFGLVELSIDAEVVLTGPG